MGFVTVTGLDLCVRYGYLLSRMETYKRSEPFAVLSVRIALLESSTSMMLQTSKLDVMGKMSEE